MCGFTFRLMIYSSVLYMRIVDAAAISAWEHKHNAGIPALELQALSTACLPPHELFSVELGDHLSVRGESTLQYSGAWIWYITCGT